ncbi:LEA type 2 family protein [Thiothrix nivea]|uniref:Water Stress and Hypersensitive response domain-containing protein n=1 Tax=Thiothrix nivea (strain ATCC 35100 / DSM 5205 / JP2) TaxID=870187 RepID=A0A656HD73_THINJ|nr:LEA type 2 family protein [Thiothrix nivea]EIJ33410.1 Water Stress and Hypersensitive response domain-containing protein [Thiothrix nivea DSM 5205]
MLKRILVFIFAPLLLSACTSVPGVIEQPKISVQNIGLQDISLTRGTALITLNVSNPNAFPIPVKGIQYGLSLNGRPVASGDRTEEQMIGARQEVPVNIPITLDFVELARLAPVAWRERRLQYDLTGAVKLPLISVPFQRQGGIGVQQ